MSEHISALAEKTELPDVGSSDVRSSARRNFLGLGLAAAVGAVTFGASPAQADILRSIKGFIYLDPLVVNFAFEMEELQADFFGRALLSDAYDELSPREKNAFALIANEDREHFEAIKKFRAKNGNKAAGSFESSNASASRRPGLFTFPGKAFKNREGLYATALDIKETALFAYHGAVDIVAKDSLLLAAAIAGVEGRHLAVLRELKGLDPFPAPFEGSLVADAAGKRLSKYGFNGGGYGFMGGTR